MQLVAWDNLLHVNNFVVVSDVVYRQLPVTSHASCMQQNCNIRVNPP